ncbi:virulence RhuM family protein [Mobiluncus sp.]|uniref:virulence RhuM family protein n=1 Tax=Mobiluncus sp. TaxID=47293 RepID=UPI0039C72973
MAQTTKPQTSLGNTEFQTMIKHDSGQFLVFTAEAGEGIEVRYQDGTIWLTQKLMAQLFDVDVRTISEHLGNIFVSEELQENSVIRKFRITASDGKSYVTKHYNLDAIISVGYRVNSIRATQFRQWATGFTQDASYRSDFDKFAAKALEASSHRKEAK